MKTDPKDSVWAALNHDLFFMRNAVRTLELKTSDKFDIFDPTTQQLLLECREPDIGVLTKAARAMGGRHNVGTSFNLVAGLPDGGSQAFRITRGNISLSLGNKPIDVFDHDNELIGRLKKKVFSFGLKFSFAGNRQHDSFTLEVKSNLLGTEGKFVIDGKEVGGFAAGCNANHAGFFREGNFGRAISISPQVPANKPLRQILLAVGIVFHKIKQ